MSHRGSDSDYLKACGGFRLYNDEKHKGASVGTNLIFSPWSLYHHTEPLHSKTHGPPLIFLIRAAH